MIRLTFLLILITLTSCEKDPYSGPTEPALPPITMEGKNTFGCKVNGKVWIPYINYTTLFIVDRPIEAYMDGDEFKIMTMINNNKNRREILSFSVSDPKIGIFKLAPPPSSGSVFSDLTVNGIYCDSYICDYNNTKIEITKFDEDKRIISGMFEFKQAVSCGDTIDITDGRFDVRF